MLLVTKQKYIVVLVSPSHELTTLPCSNISHQCITLILLAVDFEVITTKYEMYIDFLCRLSVLLSEDPHSFRGQATPS